jgi:glucuronate isomerase
VPVARFMDENFLLHTRVSRLLYHAYAEAMPIYDFHCHLPAKDIADNRGFDNLTQIWLAGDHYKWRAMRACGVPERLITGEAADPEKFAAWAGVVPSTMGNPLYHWAHLELKRYFGISGKLLSPQTAREIYATCSALLQKEEYRVRGLLERMNVRVICTTDDPADPLGHHTRLRTDPTFSITVSPTFRPDAAMAIESPPEFNAWVDRLGAAADVDIRGYPSFLEALRRRHDLFHDLGCRASDHGIEEPYADEYAERRIRRIFLAARRGTAPGPEDARAFKSALLVEFGRMNAEKQWVLQLHMGALRNVNSRFMTLLGPNTGFDTIGDTPLARPLARLLDRLAFEGSLPRTILYSLNPAANAALATMIGCFAAEGLPGKMQFGSAWWFNDQKHGMEEQLRALANIGLLSRFVGMLTDSRSFLSYPRHEYFRRILCDLLGSSIERGELPRDIPFIGKMIQDVCWNNAAAFFGIPLKN